MNAWRTETKDGVIFLFLNVPEKKQNVFNADVMAELDRTLDSIHQDIAASPSLRGLVIASEKPGSFVAGADVTQIDGITNPDEGKFKAAEGQRIFGKIAKLPVPTVAAINSYCLGGGCELALACTYRVASLDPKLRIGLPETKLGILPGWGGTQRLPRLVGIQKSLEMILAGKTLDGRGALKVGLVDRLVAPALLLDEAVKILKNPPRPAKPRLKGVAKLLEHRLLRGIIFRAARKDTMKRTRGQYPALPAVIDLIQKTLDGEVSAHGLTAEAEAFGKLVISDASRNLRYLFFLDESQKKNAPFESKPLEVHRSAVLGAGIMGGGIAWALSRQGIPVIVKDIRSEPLLGALAAAKKVYDEETKRRRLSRAQALMSRSLISTGTSFTGFGRADIVIEAVVERMDVKKEVLSEVESHVPGNCVIATNTSGLSIDEMASAMARPHRFGGLHFFNPVHRMPLVEIIRGAATDDETIATLFAISRRMGKTPILVKDAPGFLVNRVLIPYLLEAGRLLEEGVTIEAIDRAAENFGMPVGPLRLADEIGMDIGMHVARHLEASFGARMSVPAILDRFLKSKLLGKKTGRGFYIHTMERGKSKGPFVNPDAQALIASAPQPPSDAEIQDRLFLVMLLEAGRCLEERIVATPEAVDIGMIYGTGFPPFRGGLIRWGGALGHANVERRASAFRERFGERYEVPGFLRDILG